jgi:Flp pilus assembly pilin Flp
MQNLKNKKGQGLVEYILVVALMGILAIAAIQKLSTQTNRGFTTSAQKLQSALGN